MSFTALRAIERCPLHWSLSHAVYPDLWQGAGYPERPYLATLIGRIVHGALETVVRALADAGINSPGHPDAVRVLHELGGITAVLERQLHRIADALRSNPRVATWRETQAELVRALPAMRQRTQLMLFRPDLTAPEVERLGKSAHSPPAKGAAARSKALPLGAHAERTLRHPEGTWIGTADLLRLSDRECQIVDFKTGSRKGDHQLQLKLYALLWHRDTTLNPQQRLATRLSLIYPDGVEDVPPPTLPELAQIETELGSRALAARDALATSPPEARPSPDACGFCSVRQLCPAYWDPPVQFALAAESPHGGLCDAEVRIRGKAGQWTWKGIITSCGHLAIGTSVLVRARPHDTPLTALLDRANTVRLLAAQVLGATDDSSNTHVLSLSRASEVFEVS